MFDGKEIKGIIFDLDGVICSTDELHYLAWKALADDIGVYFDREINGRLRGVSRMASLDIILEKCTKKYTQSQKEELAGRKNDTYRKLLAGMTHSDVSGEVRSTLTELSARGYKLAIGSSSKNAPLILERTDSRKYFDAVSDGNNITRSKPDPEVFLKAAEFIGLPPQNCLVVEDAEAGIDAGVAGGFKTAAIGAAVGYRRADIDLKTFSGLLTVLK